MARTKKGSKPAGFYFWSRRGKSSGLLGYGTVAKWITKMKERTRNKRIPLEALATIRQQVAQEGP